MTDWAVFMDWSTYKACEVVKQTAKKTIVTSPRRGDQHLLTENVLAILPEAQAKRLVEQLTSSDALKGEEQRAAGRRHLDRVAKFVAAAEGRTAGVAVLSEPATT